MCKSIKILSVAGACVALLSGGAARAETVWKPPLEIQKADEAAATPATTEAAAPAAPAAAAPATAQSKADKEKSCSEQAAAKGLKGKAKKQFKAECLKS